MKHLQFAMDTGANVSMLKPYLLIAEETDLYTQEVGEISPRVNQEASYIDSKGTTLLNLEITFFYY